ncbi:hypothetical protein HN587_05430 [Candidatus Woesearchaeota archaeon]|jgi:tRNA (guanine26-N2/guanine27-N2)-dimethyltransferase|nr:hypothetical protein [Candidatus Woesearchaeota archaeon]
MINENGIKIKGKAKKTVDKKMETFYNPIMKLNRDLSVLLLNSIPDDQMQIGLPLAGSGIRGLRFLKELNKGKIRNIWFNDYKENYEIELCANLDLNKIEKADSINICNREANKFLLNLNGLDYIDIDPFGTPNPFLDSSIKKISRDGIIAITATDTSSLAGAYPKVCKRKYWATPSHQDDKHEIAVRILIRKVQMIGVQYEKAMIPIFSYSKDHYVRIFFRSYKGKKKCDNVVKQWQMKGNFGPLWSGKLWDFELVKKMFKENSKTGLVDINWLQLIKEESVVEEKDETADIYSIVELCQKLKINTPKFELVIKKVKKKGFEISRTHFNDNCMRSNISEEELAAVLKTLKN